MKQKTRLNLSDFQQNATKIGSLLEKRQLHNIVGGDGIYNNGVYPNYANTISYSNTIVDRPEPIPYPGGTINK